MGSSVPWVAFAFPAPGPEERRGRVSTSGEEMQNDRAWRLNPILSRLAGPCKVHDICVAACWCEFADLKPVVVAIVVRARAQSRLWESLGLSSPDSSAP